MADDRTRHARTKNQRSRYTRQAEDLAEDRRINIHFLIGTGKAGRVTKRDVEKEYRSLERAYVKDMVARIGPDDFVSFQKWLGGRA